MRRFTDEQEASARRAYRRSLPGWLRWRRRLLTGVLVLGVGGAVLAAVQGNPVSLVRTWWQDLRGEVVQVTGVKAATSPATPAQDGAEAAIDGSPATSWTTGWIPAAGVPACGDPHGTAEVHLTFPETAVREIRLITGVTDPSRRGLGLLPETMYVMNDRNECFPFTLEPGDGEQTIVLASAEPVSRLAVGISTTYPAADERAEQTVSLAEVSLWSRPE